MNTSKIFTFIFLFGSVSAFSFGSSAQEGPITQESVALVKADEISDKKLILETGAEYSQKTVVDEVGGRESGTDYTLVLGYRMNDTYSMKAKAILTKEEFGQKETKVSNTQIGLGIAGFKINDTMTSVHAVTFVAPTSEESKVRDRLQGAIGVANGIKYDGLYASVTGTVALSKNFHQYTFNSEGDANIEYKLATTIDLTIPVTEKFSLTSTGIYKIARTYGGFQRTVFEIHSDLNYLITKELNVNLGVSNDGNALKSNGVDSNIAAYNANSSVVRLGLSYVY
jgi:hypothetical protein